MKRIWLWLLLCAPIVGYSATHVQQIRLTAAADTTRVVFALSDAVAYKLFTLNKPDRVVIDEVAHHAERDRLHWHGAHGHTQRPAPERRAAARARCRGEGLAEGIPAATFRKPGAAPRGGLDRRHGHRHRAGSATACVRGGPIHTGSGPGARHRDGPAYGAGRSGPRRCAIHPLATRTGGRDGRRAPA